MAFSYIQGPDRIGRADVFSYWTRVGETRVFVEEGRAYLRVNGEAVKSRDEEPAIEALHELATSGQNGQAATANRLLEALGTREAVVRKMQHEGDVARAQIEFQMSQRSRSMSDGNIAGQYRQQGRMPENYIELEGVARRMGYDVVSGGNGHAKVYSGDTFVTTIPRNTKGVHNSLGRGILKALSDAYSV